MSQSLGFLLTTVAALVLFNVLDWLFWGTSYARKRVFPFIPTELWRKYADDPKVCARKSAQLGMLVTSFVAIVFVPLVWVLGSRFAGARVLVLALLLWAVFSLPGAFYNSTYFRIPRRMMWWQALTCLVSTTLGLVVVTWLFTFWRLW
ncbi:MAG: hypothetical protein V1723_02795 [Candidatus Uhrbacteria bacterium]